MFSMTTQQRQALNNANYRRQAICELRAELAAMPNNQSWLRVADVLDNPPELTDGCRVGHLLTACRGIGGVKIRQLMRHADVVSADKKVRDLTERQRRVLGLALRNPAIVWPSSRRGADPVTKRMRERGVTALERLSQDGWPSTSEAVDAVLRAALT